MREVRDLAGIDVRWRFFSLEEINRAEGKKHPWERQWSYGWSMMRIGAYLRRIDMDLLDRWYLAAGKALHVDGRKPHRREVAEELLSELGLDPAMAQAAIDDPTTGEEVRAEHDRVTAIGTFGVPTLIFDDGQALLVLCSSTRRLANRPCVSGMPSPLGSNFRTSTSCSGRSNSQTLKQLPQRFGLISKHAIGNRSRQKRRNYLPAGHVPQRRDHRPAVEPPSTTSSAETGNAMGAASISSITDTGTAGLER